VIRILIAAGPPEVAVFQGVGIDRSVVAFGFMVTFVTGILLGFRSEGLLSLRLSLASFIFPERAGTALGATLRDVTLMVLRKGMGLVLLGLLFGMAGGIASTLWLSNLLYPIRPNDPQPLRRSESTQCGSSGKNNLSPIEEVISCTV
jgi:hypothetical protein